VWSLRDLIANGTLRRVRIPLPGHGEMRKILLDRDDLDRVIEEVWKEPSDTAPPRSCPVHPRRSGEAVEEAHG
jgi:hypothetical protein